MFQSSLEEYYDEQRKRLNSNLDRARVDEAFAELERRGLDAEAVTVACARELRMILVKRYEQPIKSTRLNGHGWTVMHVQDHMRRFLKSKLREAGEVMRFFLSPSRDEAPEEEEPEQGLAANLDELVFD